MTTAIAFPGQPGDPFGDPQMDLTMLELSDGFLALSQAAVALDTDEADRVPDLLADVDVVAYVLGEMGKPAAARALSDGAALVREALEASA